MTAFALGAALVATIWLARSLMARDVDLGRRAREHESRTERSPGGGGIDWVSVHARSKSWSE